MQRCPTCGARHRGGPECHRCRTDLRQVLLIERCADGLRQRARADLAAGHGAKARAAAERACALHRCPESLAVRAVVALHGRDFALALRLWFERRTSAGD